MIEPLASSLISVLRGTLHLVERSTYIKSNSPALENLREAVYETIAELEAASKRESKKNTSKFPAAESLNVECPKATQRTPRHSPRVPELQTRYDENGIPVSTKCSTCGEQMPQSTPRITNPIENVKWFAAQFSLHVAQSHPLLEPRNSAFGRILMD
jgi:hypothetical protein